MPVLRMLFLLPLFLTTAAAAEPPHRITIDGKFDDWAAVPAHTDPAHTEHDTDHTGRHDRPAHVDHADVDILAYKFTHDADNLYAYFKARGVIGRTQRAAPGRPAGRYYAIVALDVDADERTGYWLHEGGFYPTSRGYDLNAEIEWYDGHFNVGDYLNHGCENARELDQAFLDQSAGRYQKGKDGPYPPGFVRLAPGTYRHYTQWVYHDSNTITFVRDKYPRRQEGLIRGALSADGHELEMVIPMKGFLKDQAGKPIVALGRRLHVSFSLEASGELAAGRRWASDTAAPIKNYRLEAPRK